MVTALRSRMATGTSALEAGHRAEPLGVQPPVEQPSGPAPHGHPGEHRPDDGPARVGTAASPRWFRRSRPGAPARGKVLGHRGDTIKPLLTGLSRPSTAASSDLRRGRDGGWDVVELAGPDPPQ